MFRTGQTRAMFRLNARSAADGCGRTWSGLKRALPEKEMELATRASVACEVFLSIGTSTVVYPAAALPTEALRHGAVVIEINPQPTPLTARAHFVLTGAAGVVLPQLLAELKKHLRPQVV